MRLFIIVEIIILILIGRNWLKKNKDGGFSWLMCQIVFLTVCNALAVAIGSMILFSAILPTREQHYSFKIHALQDNLVTKGEIHGGHFSTRGYIDGEMKYFFMRSMGYGDKMGYIPAKKTYIKYDNDTYPHIDVYKNVPDPPELVVWLVGDWAEHMYIEADRYIMTVPEGSVIDGVYEIDMQ